VRRLEWPIRIIGSRRLVLSANVAWPVGDTDATVIDD
jgi:hypothetical protein